MLKTRGITQKKLADEVGYKSQAAVSRLLNSNEYDMRVDTFVKLCDAMDCEVVVRLRRPVPEGSRARAYYVLDGKPLYDDKYHR